VLLLMAEDYCSIGMAMGTVTVKHYNLAIMGAVMILCLDRRFIFYAHTPPPLAGRGCEASNWLNGELGLVSNRLTHLGSPEQKLNLTLTYHLVNSI